MVRSGCRKDERTASIINETLNFARNLTERRPSMMTVPTGTRDKHNEYTRYAEHCLKMAKQNLEHDSRIV